MKTIKILSLLFITAIVITGCEKKDNIPSVAKDSFKNIYSGTSSDKWESKGGYYVVEFRHEGKEKEAWFDSNGTWWLTETEVPVSKLPAVIKDAINNSKYSNWRIDDVDYIEKRDATPFYVVEVEYRDQNMDLYYSPEGVFIKETNGDDNRHNMPNTSTNNSDIVAAVNSKYPNAKIFDIEIEYNYIEIDLAHQGIYWEMTLDKQYNWIRSTREFNWNDVPSVIKNTFQQAGYTFDLREDDVYQIVLPEAGIDVVIYHIELDREPNDIDIFIKEDGTLLDHI